MKKLLFMILAAFFIAACDPDNFQDMIGSNPSNPSKSALRYKEKNNPNTFYPYIGIDGLGDWGLHLVNPFKYPNSDNTGPDWETYHAAAGYSPRRIAIALTNSTDQFRHEPHAVAFDKLAEEYQDRGIEFVMIFVNEGLALDAFDNPPDTMRWIKKVTHMDRVVKTTTDPSRFFFSTYGPFSFDSLLPQVYFVHHDKIFRRVDDHVGDMLHTNEAMTAKYYKRMKTTIEEFISRADAEDQKNIEKMAILEAHQKAVTATVVKSLQNI